MAEYTYLTADLMTGQLLREMEFTAVGFTESTRGSDTFSASIDRANVNATRAILNPEGTLVVVERDGVIVWSGIYWDPLRRDRDTLGVECAGIGHYLDHLYLDVPRSYASVDVATIVTELLADAALKDDVLPINVPAISATGSLRTVAFLPEDQTGLAEALDTLGGTTGGFDWGIEAVWIGNPRAARYDFRLDSPSRGVPSDWVLEYGANVSDYDMPIMGSRRATDVQIIGQGSGQSSRRAVASDRTIKPRMELYRKITEQIDQGALDDQAAAVLAARRKEVTTIDLQMTPGTKPGYEQITPGDRAKLRIDDGYWQFDGPVRVTNRAVTPGDVEQITLTVVDESAVSE